MRKDFAVFILTYGRANNVPTLEQLDKGNYTGKTYLIVDDTDEQVPLYKKNYGEDNVIVFNKEELRGTFDLADNFDGNNVVVFARNKVHQIAESLGLKHFLVLDDDYTSFLYRYKTDEKLASKYIKDFNGVFNAMTDFLDVSGAKTVAFSQGGDLIGGADNNNLRKGLLRKAMNSFFCRTDRPFQFIGRINEDATTYTQLGTTGNLFFTYVPINLTQARTQKNEKGLTEIYLELGTYVKSFYSVMVSPSIVTVNLMGTTNQRLHHRIAWNNCTPKILSEDYKK